MIEIDVYLSLLLVSHTIYPIILFIDSTPHNTTGETTIEINFQLISICSKVTNNSDNRPLIITVNNIFEGLKSNLIQFESSSCSTSKKLIDISSTNDNK